MEAHDDHAAADGRPDQLADKGHKQRETNDVGQKPRQHQQDASHHDHRSAYQFGCRHPTFAPFCRKPPQHSHPLAADHQCAQEARSEDEAKRSPKSDRSSDQNKTSDFGQRPSQENNRKEW